MTALGLTSTSPQAVIALRSYLNPQGPTQETIMNFSSQDSLQAAAGESHTIIVAAAAVNQAFALATLFPGRTAPIFLSVSEIAAPASALGFAITTASNASGKMYVGVAGEYTGAWTYTADGSHALPTVYIDNLSSTTQLVLSIGAMTQ